MTATGDPGPGRVPIRSVSVAAYSIPTDQPEQDGTLDWDSTGLVLVEVTAGDATGYGWSYANSGAAAVVSGLLAGELDGANALAVGENWGRMWRAVRNNGHAGLSAMAVSAVDVALWDLKAKLLGVPLVTAIDACHDACPIYGSGGFTNYSLERLADQVRGWAEAGIPRVKIKVARDPDADAERAKVVRAAIGDDVEFFVDANGALTRKDALLWARRYKDEYDVHWFEEPLTSDDLAGLRMLRDRGPGGLDIAAGEYGFNLPYFRDMLRAGAVDCLQADVTRCGGITGFLRVGALCEAETIELSGHCAPNVTAQAACGVAHLRHLEYFHDHVRIENLYFDGALQPQPGGVLRPDLTRPGHGMTPKRADLEEFRA